jgi:hypothetical protein
VTVPLLLAAGIAAAVSGTPVESASCLELLDTSTASVARSVLRFEAAGDIGPNATRAAKEVLARASAARDRLEAATVSEFCEPSRREELVYLNHLTLGFAGWLEAGLRRPTAAYDVRSIVRRARVHQARGRERLGSGRNP